MAKYKVKIDVKFKLSLDLNELIYLKNIITQDITLVDNPLTYKKDLLTACNNALEEYKNAF